MNKNILVIASPHTGILDNIFPYMYLASIVGVIKFDLLISQRQLNSLRNNSFNQELSLKYFETWNIVVDDDIIAFPVWYIRAYFSFIKIFRLQVKSNNKYFYYLSKIAVNVIFRRLFSVGYSNLASYNVAFGDTYIFSRRDSEPFANKINKMTFLNVQHGVNPHAKYQFDYIYDLPSKMFYLPMTKSEIDYFNSSEVGAEHKLVPDFGLLRHNESWRKVILHDQSEEKIVLSNYILVVSRPPDHYVTVNEMNLYYSEILKFVKSKNISLVVKPHLWETYAAVFARLEIANAI